MPKHRPIQPGTQICFQCGDVVAREDDPRHEGKVVAVFDNCARVQWKDTKHKEDVDQDELVLVERKKRRSGGPTIRPATVVESPRARLERLLWRKHE